MKRYKTVNKWIKNPNIKRKTNVEIVTEIMEYSRFGALSQAFVVNAIAEEAKRVANINPKDVDTKDWQFISFEAWNGVAKEIVEKLETSYNRNLWRKFEGKSLWQQEELK